MPTRQPASPVSIEAHRPRSLARATGMARLLSRLRGGDPHPTSHAEKLLSMLGAFVGILGVVVISRGALDAQGAGLVVTSMGASAVLLFAAPHSPLSQPWSLLGGHLLSSAIGITCALLIDDKTSAAALAVALSVAAMHYLRCLHPPAGGTALAIVVDGQMAATLGYAFLVTPVLLNAVVLLSVAMLFNAPFRHRRYPLWLTTLADHDKAAGDAAAAEKCLIAHSDLVYALSEMDSFIDVSETDLLRIYELATRQAMRQQST